MFTFWKENVSKHHSPKYELVQSSGDKTFGCTLHLHFPPEATRTFVVPAHYPTKKEAKDAVSKLAMQYHACEDAKAAREEAGPEPEKVKPTLSNLPTVDNPVGVLSQAYQRFMPVGELDYEYLNDPLSTLNTFIANVVRT